MKKILEFFYIFTKFSTSFILLICLVTFGYFFYISYDKQKKSNKEQFELLNKYNENAKKISEIAEKISITEKSLNEIKIAIKEDFSSSNSKEIMALNAKIDSLSAKVEATLFDLEKTKLKPLTKSENISENGSNLVLDQNKSQLIKLILFRFENNLNFDVELKMLQDINESKNNYIFEKINLISLKNFRGVDNLDIIFNDELNLFLKTNFQKESKNIFSKTLMKFVDIEPSKKNNIKNNEISLLKELKDYIDKKNFDDFNKKIVNIQNHEKYFNESISQINIFLSFKELLNKVS